MEAYMNWAVAAIGVVIFFYLYRRMRKNTREQSYEAELHNILHNDDNKAKGRFE